jgi:hypothetical protein
MADDAGLREILAHLERILADLRRYERDGDAISLRRAGGLLSIKEAADVWRRCREKIRKDCEIADAANDPLGFKIGPNWIIVTARLLDWIKRTDTEDAWSDACRRAKKYS